MESDKNKKSNNFDSKPPKEELYSGELGFAANRKHAILLYKWLPGDTQWKPVKKKEHFKERVVGLSNNWDFFVSHWWLRIRFFVRKKK